MAETKNGQNLMGLCNENIPMAGPIVKLKFVRKIRGKALERCLKEGSDALLVKLEEGLAPYDGVALGLQWKDFYWKVEEFINLFEDLDREDKELFSNALVSASYTNPKSLCKSLLHIRERYGVDTAKRMFSLATLFRDTEIGTVGELYYYCKSRRLHFAPMLYLIPIYAKGDKRIDWENLIYKFVLCI